MASIGTRLYRGELGYDFIGRRRRWYIISAVFVGLCLASMLFRGFNFGIEFEGGNSFQFPGTEQQLEQAEAAAQDTGVEVASAQVVGQDSILLRTAELSNETAAEVSSAVAGALGIEVTSVSNSAVSAQWGGDITTKALQALAVFLVAVVIFIAIRFQPKMAVAALAALVNDLIVAAGVYSLVGFEVTPSTVIGLLTILGFSLYDTVVVFDKVDENTRGILGGSRTTYSEAANLAVNQTLMRSINTSLIALLPVAGLLFVGAGLLGAGTLKDLALVLFVGLATGAYSSIFLATPILCDLKEREPAYAALRKRVEARRASGRGADAEPVRPVKAAPKSGKGPAKGSSRPSSGGGKPGARPTPKVKQKATTSQPKNAAASRSSGTASKQPTVAPASPAAGRTSVTAVRAADGSASARTAATVVARRGTATQLVKGSEPGQPAVTPGDAPPASAGAAEEALRPSARRRRPATTSPPAEAEIDDAEVMGDDEAAETDSAAAQPATGGQPTAGSTAAASAPPAGAAAPVRPAGQRNRTGRPSGSSSTSRRGGRPSGKRKR